VLSDSENTPAASDPTLSGIRDARAQFEAAQNRQQSHRRAGRLADTSAFVSKGMIPGFTLLSELHRGGQGTVYLATQESTGRQVAVKVLRAQTLGSGSTGAARFQREVEILSRLKHPNIVTIHDCGRSLDDVYLVMDYVDGQPFDVHVAEQNCSIRETLAIFAKACDAVSAANNRGVIHRDLKPRNILVDEHGEPRVLDFGLAKIVDDSARTTTLDAMTRTGQFVGSLPWTSPEQARGCSDLVDVRSDVYSLGVVLYQLLTRQFPYPVLGRLDQVARHVIETDPTRPSAHEKAVDRELETIVLKALAKEPDRRYQTAGELARDIRRYLAGEPIEARRDSLAYVMAKQLGRYRLAAGVSTLVLAAMGIALIVSMASWRRVEQERLIAQQNAVDAQLAAKRADSQAAQAHAVMEFLSDVLRSPDPDNDGATVRLIDVIAEASAGAAEHFSGQPQREAQVRDLLGGVFSRLSMHPQARAEFGRAAELWRQCAGPDDPRTLTSELAYENELVSLQRTDELERVQRDLLPRLERAFGPDDRRTLLLRRDAAFTRMLRNQLDEAEAELASLRGHPALADDDAVQIKLLGGLIGVRFRRSVLVGYEAGQPLLEECEPLADELVARSSRLSGPQALSTLHTRDTRAHVLVRLERYHDAAAECREILASSSAARLGECHVIRRDAMSTLAESLYHLGDDAAAADLRLRCVECVRGAAATEAAVRVTTLMDSLPYMDRSGRGREGEAISRDLRAALDDRGAVFAGLSRQAELWTAHFVSMQGRLEEADAAFQSLRERLDELPPAIAARLGMLHGRHLTRKARFAEAECELLAALDFYADATQLYWQTGPPDVLAALVELYDAWGDVERSAEARLRLQHGP
jgi:eukaryotic-like serine/threonine-protein kinase